MEINCIVSYLRLLCIFATLLSLANTSNSIRVLCKHEVEHKYVGDSVIFYDLPYSDNDNDQSQVITIMFQSYWNSSYMPIGHYSTVNGRMKIYDSHKERVKLDMNVDGIITFELMNVSFEDVGFYAAISLGKVVIGNIRTFFNLYDVASYALYVSVRSYDVSVSCVTGRVCTYELQSNATINSWIVQNYTSYVNVNEYPGMSFNNGRLMIANFTSRDPLKFVVCLITEFDTMKFVTIFIRSIDETIVTRFAMQDVRGIFQIIHGLQLNTFTKYGHSRNNSIWKHGIQYENNKPIEIFMSELQGGYHEQVTAHNPFVTLAYVFCLAIIVFVIVVGILNIVRQMGKKRKRFINSNRLFIVRLLEEGNMNTS